MKHLLYISSIVILSFSFTSCSQNKGGTNANNKIQLSSQQAESAIQQKAKKSLSTQWLITSKEFDDMSLVHKVFLVVNGKKHEIDNEVYSLKDKVDYGELNAEDTKSYNAISGYNFEWHVSSANFYVKEEDGNLVVYAEESGDENEGRADTRKIKTIAIK